MKKNLLGILCLTLSILAISCKKDSVETTAQKEQLQYISGTYHFSDFPAVSDGMLCSGIQLIFQIT